MILSEISVRRPVFATVLSLLLVAFGLLSFNRLPVREFPDTNPPIVSIETNYSGASAEVVENRITIPIEDRISGIEGIRTINATSRDGSSDIVVEFAVGRDIDAAANDIRDRVSRVLDNLPPEADPPEVQKVDNNAGVIMWLNLSSTTLNGMELTDYARRNLVDRFTTVEGVANVRVGGAKNYSMRIWLDRRELAARALTVSDVEAALRAANVELPGGRLESVEREFTVRTLRSYTTAADFRALVLRRGEDGYLVRLGDVARVEVGPSDYRSELRGNGESMVGLGIVRQSTANTLAVAQGVKAEAESVRQSLPSHITLHDSYDTSVFIEEAINEVYETLVITGLLVILVIFLFLGNVRATLVPAVTVPVSLIASMMVLHALGYSVNLLTLLALVLAIGLVVDDAIVMLENVSRRIELGEPPLLAAYRGSRQVGFAIVATTAVLIAVFLPITFLEGDTGRLFTEFAVAMSAAVFFSSVVALTLSPVMCSAILRRQERPSRFKAHIDRQFERLSAAYRTSLEAFLRVPWVVLLIFAFVGWGIYSLSRDMPKEFAPKEDRGAFFLIVRAPEGASYDYTRRYMLEVEEMLLPLVDEGLATRVLIRVPNSFGSTATVNGGFGIVVMAPWRERSKDTFEVMGGIMGKLQALPGVRAFPFMRQGIGGGSEQSVQFVIGGPDYEQLVAWRDTILEKAREHPGLTGVDADYQETKPQILVAIDRDRAAELGVSVRAIGSTLETMLGSRRVTTFIERGEEYDVILQGEDADRRSPTDISNLYLRSETTGELIPLSNLTRLAETADAVERKRFNRKRAITISAGLTGDMTLGEALNFLEEQVRTHLPPDATIDYKGESRDLIESEGSLAFVFGLALLVVFLVMAAQFESFRHPLVIILTVPLAIVGALAGLAWTDGSLNIYSQIGIVMLIGLAAKNGILIVEFANQLRDKQETHREALLKACALRLRPILMTALSTAMGAVPLVLASGAGAASRETIGVVIFAGILSSTFLTLYVVPVLYDLLTRSTRSPEALTRELHELESSGAAHH